MKCMRKALKALATVAFDLFDPLGVFGVTLRRPLNLNTEFHVTLEAAAGRSGASPGP